jgi:hypothetical protein
MKLVRYHERTDEAIRRRRVMIQVCGDLVVIQSLEAGLIRVIVGLRDDECCLKIAFGKQIYLATSTGKKT